MSWTKIKPPKCDGCNRDALWQHPDGGLRCAFCPRPEAKAETPVTSSIKWKASKDSHCKSEDGRWSIVPLYCGRHKPQFYELHQAGKPLGGWHQTQRDAKAAAEAILAKESK